MAFDTLWLEELGLTDEALGLATFGAKVLEFDAILHASGALSRLSECFGLLLLPIRHEIFVSKPLFSFIISALEILGARFSSFNSEELEVFSGESDFL